MPLIDLKTNLKSLKFTGAAPYVTKDINNPPVYGALSNEISSRVDDVSRLVKLLADTPGVKFISHQALLQASDPANASDKRTVIGRAIDVAGNVLKNTARTVGTALAQAGVNGTGTHFIQPSPEYYYTAGSAAQIASVNSEVTQTAESPLLLKNKVSRYNLNGDKPSEVYNDKIWTSASLAAYNDGSVIIPTGKKGTKSLESKYGFAQVSGSDSVGLTDIYSSGSSEEISNLKKDLVPIIFGKYPDLEYKLFRGFIGSITDNFQANWNSQKYVGRMENFFIYTGFNRTISFNLTIPIFSEEEQPIVYNKVNALVSHTAPEYKNGTGIPSGIITHLRIGDYLDTPGVLNSVGITVDNNIPWSAGPGTSPMLLPQVLQVAVQFTPIHTETPQYHNSALSSTEQQLPYIGNTQKVKSNKL